MKRELIFRGIAIEQAIVNLQIAAIGEYGATLGGDSLGKRQVLQGEYGIRCVGVDYPTMGPGIEITADCYAAWTRTRAAKGGPCDGQQGVGNVQRSVTNVKKDRAGDGESNLVDSGSRGTCVLMTPLLAALTASDRLQCPMTLPPLSVSTMIMLMGMARASPDITRNKNGSAIAANVKRRGRTCHGPLPATAWAALANFHQLTNSGVFGRLSHSANLLSIHRIRVPARRNAENTLGGTCITPARYLSPRPIRPYRRVWRRTPRLTPWPGVVI